MATFKISFSSISRLESPGPLRTIFTPADGFGPRGSCPLFDRGKAFLEARKRMFYARMDTHAISLEGLPIPAALASVFQ